MSRYTWQTTATFDKFLLAQASGDIRAVDILRPLRLRYFSPEELLRLFCFEDTGSDSTFRWPESVSTKTKYRLIGNSVNVLVVSALIEYLCQRYGFKSVKKPWQEDAERTRLNSLTLNHYYWLPFTGIDCFLWLIICGCCKNPEMDLIITQDEFDCTGL